MRFLADESCDFAIVRALRAAGHDVLAVVDVSPRAADPNVIDLAVRDNRILLTEDKNFGQLVYSSGTPSAGVEKAQANGQDLLKDLGERLDGEIAEAREVLHGQH